MPSFMDLQESEFPISLKESTSTHPKSHHLTVPLPVPPSKKFLSNSLPNSANSSPRFASKKKCNKNQNNQPSPLSRQHSVALANLERLKEDHLRRSKSCGEGRSSAPLEKLTNVKHVEENRVVYQSSGGEDKAESIIDQKFKCGAMCLFIPGLGKAKQVRARRVETEIVLQHDMGQQHNVSRKVSLEKFECGSWTSSAIINDEENDDDESKNLFFDLPIELIQCSDGDKDMNCSPVTAAFVFDKEPKGVLKNNSSTPKTADRKSNESSTTRHVRFSTSSPDSGSPTSCMTPRLRKARDDFNALLEAQCA